MEIDDALYKTPDNTATVQDEFYVTPKAQVTQTSIQLGETVHLVPYSYMVNQLTLRLSAQPMVNTIHH